MKLHDELDRKIATIQRVKAIVAPNLSWHAYVQYIHSYSTPNFRKETMSVAQRKKVVAALQPKLEHITAAKLCYQLNYFPMQPSSVLPLAQFKYNMEKPTVEENVLGKVLPVQNDGIGITSTKIHHTRESERTRQLNNRATKRLHKLTPTTNLIHKQYPTGIGKSTSTVQLRKTRSAHPSTHDIHHAQRNTWRMCLFYAATGIAISIITFETYYSANHRDTIFYLPTFPTILNESQNIHCNNPPIVKPSHTKLPSCPNHPDVYETLTHSNFPPTISEPAYIPVPSTMLNQQEIILHRVDILLATMQRTLEEPSSSQVSFEETSIISDLLLLPPPVTKLIPTPAHVLTYQVSPIPLPALSGQLSNPEWYTPFALASAIVFVFLQLHYNSNINQDTHVQYGRYDDQVASVTIIYSLKVFR